MSKLWERLRRSPRLKGWFLFAIVAALVVGSATLPNAQEAPLADAERLAFDLQMRLLRKHYPRLVAEDVILIGIDEETERVFTEPIALWHRHFAAVLHALAKAKPRAVGVDFVLPERSFDGIVPGLDLAMMRGLFDLKRAGAPFVYVQAVNSRGELVPIQPNYARIVAEGNLGLDQQLTDPDTVSRRFSEREISRSAKPAPTLSGQLMRSIKVPIQEGYIDYSLGAPVTHVPFHAIAAWGDRKLAETFGNRIVLIGYVTGTNMDRWLLPVKLMAYDPGRAEGDEDELQAGRRGYYQPGVLTHLQVIRSHLGSGLLRPFPEWARWTMCAIVAFVVFARARPRGVVAAAVVVPAILVGTSLMAIVSAQLLLPIASIILSFWLALVARGVFDAIEAAVDRLRLEQSFAGQVSPAVMKEMMGGTLSPGVSGQLAEVCVLFSDVRDFTTLSEKMPPEVVTTVLQRYFDRMVHAVHRFDGTVDKFIGDGMMILFGAPLKLADPCGDGVQCALAMMAELDQLNVEFEREGLPVLTIGIGINFGTVTVGNIGSSERHNYSAIGDAVNVAARLEGLTKDLGRKILITEAVVSRIGERFHFDPLGSHKLKGHSPVTVWGIRTARAAPAVAEAEAVQ